MYDIVFISYKEPNAEANWARLQARFPFAKRVHGVQGIHQAHIAAAQKCYTDMFWVVDGDAAILDLFQFDYAPKDLDYVYVWRSINPVNGLQYGNGGVKLLPRTMAEEMDITKPDMTTSISTKFKPVFEVSNITAFNTDPFNTWKSAFRECCKLSSKIIDRQKTDETDERLGTWCTLNENVPYGFYSYAGALAGQQYGIANKGNTEALRLINNFKWLEEKFDEYQRSIR
jgi:hypothetical protein